MILIGCRTYGYWKSGGWIFSNFLVLKKGDLWRFLLRICNHTTLSLRATPDTPNTANAYDFDTDTPFPPDTDVSSFSGSGISWFDNRHFPSRHCDLLIASLVYERSRQETKTRFYGRALTGERSVNFLIHWLPENLSTETWRRLLTDINWKWRGRAVPISNPIHQYTPIDSLVNTLINRMDESDRGTHQYDSRHQEALPDWSINGEVDTPIYGHKLSGDGDGPCLFPIRDINIHLLIYLSINWSINRQTKRTEGHISVAADIRTHYLTDLSIDTWRPLSTYQNWRTGRVYFRYHTLIFTYWSIDWSID